MVKLTLLSGVALVAALAATPALAAQLIPVDISQPDAQGNAFASAAFDWPEEGTRAFARIDLVNLEVLDLTLTGYVQGQATWWDPGVGGVTGNEYQLAFDCSAPNGCLALNTQAIWTGRIETPRGFDKPCGPATVGDCSFHYDPQFGALDGYFRVISPDMPFSATLTIGDAAAIPEPATWAMLILGFALSGLMFRRSMPQGDLDPAADAQFAACSGRQLRGRSNPCEEVAIPVCKRALRGRLEGRRPTRAMSRG